MTERFDVAIVGAGAAGLTAAIFGSGAGARVVALDGARRIGAKILIAGGGRCNVTHDIVTPDDFNGSRNAIAKVLRTFSVAETIRWFESIGVTLKREEGGKMFPVTDRAQTVLDALLRAADAARIESGRRVLSIARSDVGFRIETSRGPLECARVILATGGRSVPKTGSDGSGYALAASLGHIVTPQFPALVPLLLPKNHWALALSGTSVEADVAVLAPGGRLLRRERGSMLFTHFGLSGPVILDISRHWIAAGRGARLIANLLPGRGFDDFEREVIREARANPHATAAGFLRRSFPDRLASGLAGAAALDRQQTLGRLTRDERRELVRNVIELPLPVTGDRGFDYAEVTAGGVPLAEVNTATMESRVVPGLHLCGEILDVDGKIGGYNFQWAWASGRLAGMSAAVL